MSIGALTSSPAEGACTQDFEYVDAWICSTIMFFFISIWICASFLPRSISKVITMKVKLCVRALPNFAPAVEIHNASFTSIKTLKVKKLPGTFCKPYRTKAFFSID